MGKDSDKEEKVDPPSRTRKYLCYFNSLIALGVISVGISQYVILFTTNKKKITVKNLQILFQPFYLIFFGFILFLGECGFKFIKNVFPFLKKYIGIGMYNIFLASNLGQPQPDASKAEEISFIVFAYLLFSTGVIYIFIFWIVNDSVTEKDRKKQEEKIAKKKAEQLKKEKQLDDEINQSTKPLPKDISQLEDTSQTEGNENKSKIASNQGELKVEQVNLDINESNVQVKSAQSLESKETSSNNLDDLQQKESKKVLDSAQLAPVNQENKKQNSAISNNSNQQKTKSDSTEINISQQQGQKNALSQENSNKSSRDQKKLLDLFGDIPNSSQVNKDQQQKQNQQGSEKQ